MSEHYDFHYQPTGSGAISGQQVLQQTEDAINELGDYVNDNVGGAMDVAQQALETAQNAEQDAQTALDTANSFSSAIQSAQQDANTALSTAQTAQNTASNANNTAIQAQQDASSAVTTANNASGQVSTLSGTVTTLGQRVTTAEGNIGQNTSDITALTTRVGTAEGNITTLQNDVSIAQGNASSAMATAGTVKQQAYVLRYSSSSVTDNSTIAFSTLDNTDNIKSGDKVIDVDGKIFSVISVDTANSTVTVGSALVDLALDGNVVHTSGNETVGGVKNFSDDTYVNNINFTREVASTSASTTSVLQLINTVTYTDQTADKVAILNFRITADGIKSLYPHENNQYALGLESRKWSEVHGVTYYYGSSDVEFSNKFCTLDTDQTVTSIKSFMGLRTEFKRSNNDGVLLFSNGTFSKGDTPSDVTQISRKYYGDATSVSSSIGYSSFSIQNNGNKTVYQLYSVANTAGSSSRTVFTLNYDKSLSGTDAQYATFGGNVLPDATGTYNLGDSTNKWATINGLEPSALGMPDLSNGVDISSYFTLDTSKNTYTPSANGWICIKGVSSGSSGIYVESANGFYCSATHMIDIDSSNHFVNLGFPVIKNEQYTIVLKTVNISISAKFYPCQGNV